MASEMADSLVALHNHLAGAYSRRYSTSIRPRAALPAEPAVATEPAGALDGPRMVVLLTAWSVMVSRIADQDRLLIGVHTGGRMLPVRLTISGAPSSNDLMEHCRRELDEAERMSGRGFAVLRFQFTFGPTAAPTPPFQLHLHATIADGRLSLRCDYSPSHFTEGAATVILEQYRALLEAMAADPDMPVNCLIIDQAPPGTTH
ncbi:MAG: hypothetical protein ABSH47_04930 [Bryobacteraceae bacterium]|jgi:non-ribosomal peptide synthetase component F